jgi:aryl-alcohol dehydrogenase-like predicted oxidoreductase
MRYRKLGQSGLLVSDLSLGTMTFGDDSPRGTPEHTALAMMETFFEAGGNFLDTANVYAGGRSEEIVGKALRTRRDQVVLATKVRGAVGSGPNDEGLSRKHILSALHASLKRLNTDYVDLYYLHVWDPLTPLAESLRTLADLVTQGAVRYVGVSNFSAWQVMKALALQDAHAWPRFVAAQYQYSLVERDIEDEFSALCRAEGVGLLPWGPLGGGFLSGKYQPGARPREGRIATHGDTVEEAWHRRNTERNWDILEAVDEIARAHGATHAQVALAWLRAQSPVSSVILGARTPEQLEDNLGAAHLELTEADLTRLEALSRPPARYPYRMIAQYGERSPDKYRT